MPEAETYSNWTLQYNTIQHDMIRYDTPIPMIQYNTYNTIQYDTPIPVLYISTRARSKSIINQECQRLKPKLTEHYNIIQYNTIWYDTILPFLWYNTIHTIQYDTPIPVLYISTRARSKSIINQEGQRLKPTLTEQYNIIQYNTIWYDTILPFLWYNTIQYNTIRYSHPCAVHFNTCSQQVDD